MKKRNSRASTSSNNAKNLISFFVYSFNILRNGIEDRIEFIQLVLNPQNNTFEHFKMIEINGFIMLLVRLKALVTEFLNSVLLWFNIAKLLLKFSQTPTTAEIF